MNYVLAVFRSRTHTLAFVDAMKNYGISCRTAPTPREALIGCGISACFATEDYERARRIISAKRYLSFLSFFAVSKTSRGMTVRKI